MSPRERPFKRDTGITRCRSCKAPIVWAQTWRGNRMPVDAVPVQADEGGNLYFEAGVVRHVLPGIVLDPAIDLFTSHFATCPNADEWRKERETQ